EPLVAGSPGTGRPTPPPAGRHAAPGEVHRRYVRPAARPSGGVTVGRGAASPRRGRATSARRRRAGRAAARGQSAGDAAQWLTRVRGPTGRARTPAGPRIDLVHPCLAGGQTYPGWSGDGGDTVASDGVVGVDLTVVTWRYQVDPQDPHAGA